MQPNDMLFAAMTEARRSRLTRDRRSRRHLRDGASPRRGLRARRDATS
jgi:hypothetical protein